MDISQVIKNPDEAALRTMVAESKHKAARRIIDEATSDVWCWPAELGTHREVADALNLAYSRPPGAGDIITVDS